MSQVTLREYFAALGSSFSDGDARVIGPELERLGAVTAAGIVDAARPEDAPLHPYFEWDDAQAADLYRQDQARYMARSIVVHVRTLAQQEEPVRAFVAVRIDPPEPGVPEPSRSVDRAYVALERVVADADLAEQVIEDAHRQLLAWSSRYRSYRRLFHNMEQRFGPIFDAIEDIERNGTGK